MKEVHPLQIIAEIDYLYYCLESMMEKEKKRSPMDKMIDEASGFDKAKIKEAKSIIRMIERRKKKLETIVE